MQGRANHLWSIGMQTVTRHANDSLSTAIFVISFNIGLLLQIFGGIQYLLLAQKNSGKFGLFVSIRQRFI